MAAAACANFGAMLEAFFDGRLGNYLDLTLGHDMVLQILLQYLDMELSNMELQN